MTDTTQFPPEERDDDFEAAEFALGLTPPELYPQVRDRVLRDRDFSLLVAAWQERLAAMTDEIEEVQPGKQARRQLLARLFPKKRVPLMERLWLWQGVALGALVLAVWMSTPMLRPDALNRASGPIYATELAGEDSGYQVFAVLDPSRQGIALRRVAGDVPDGRVLELWAILPDAEGPVSLGLVPPEPQHLRLPAEFAERINELTLAISDEPPGGSPTGAPTGDVLALGAVSQF